MPPVSAPTAIKDAMRAGDRLDPSRSSTGDDLEIPATVSNKHPAVLERVVRLRSRLMRHSFDGEALQDLRAGVIGK